MLRLSTPPCRSSSNNWLRLMLPFRMLALLMTIFAKPPTLGKCVAARAMPMVPAATDVKCWPQTQRQAFARCAATLLGHLCVQRMGTPCHLFLPGHAGLGWCGASKLPSRLAYRAHTGRAGRMLPCCGPQQGPTQPAGAACHAHAEPLFSRIPRAMLEWLGHGLRLPCQHILQCRNRKRLLHGEVVEYDWGKPSLCLRGVLLRRAAPHAGAVGTPSAQLGQGPAP